MSIEVKKVHRTANIIGVPVKNPAGENLGKIEEVVIDLETGRVAYLVVSFGGFLRMGEKLFAIPWEAVSLKYGEAAQYFVLHLDREKLASAGVQQGRLARHGQSEMDGGVRGVSPTHPTQGGQRATDWPGTCLNARTKPLLPRPRFPLLDVREAPR